MVGKLGHQNVVFCKTFGSVFRRLGHENGVFGQAWTLLGHCLDAFRTSFIFPILAVPKSRFPGRSRYDHIMFSMHFMFDF